MTCESDETDILHFSDLDWGRDRATELDPSFDPKWLTIYRPSRCSIVNF